MRLPPFARGVTVALLATSLIAATYHSPLYQTPPAGDNSQKAATTAFVRRDARQGSWTQTGAGTATRSIDGKLQDLPILLTDFPGVDRSGNTPIDAAWTAFIASVQAQRRPGHVPYGRYKFAAQALIDLQVVAGQGFVLTCDGENNTLFDVTSAPTSAPQFQIKSTSPNPDAFYVHIAKCGIAGNTPNTVLRIGSANNSDAINGARFDDLWVANSDATSATAASIEINGLYNSSVRVTANNGTTRGAGDAILIRSAQFSEFFLAGGHARCAVALRDNYVFGNVFKASDYEEVTYDVCITSPNAARNTWLGGQFVYGPPASGSGTYGAINATAGVENLFLNVNTGPSYGGSSIPIVTGIGVAIMNGQGVTTGGPVPAAWNVTSAGGTLQLQTNADGTGYLSNYAAGKPLNVNSPGGVTINNDLTAAAGLRATALPTSCTGQQPATIWSDAGTLKLCP